MDHGAGGRWRQSRVPFVVRCVTLRVMRPTTILAFSVLLSPMGCGDDPVQVEIYEPCRTDAECTSRRCEEVTVEGSSDVTRRFCTATCGEPDDCPSVDGRRAVCTSIGDSPALCWASCSADRDCAEGFECEGSLCVPALDDPEPGPDGGSDPETRADYEPCVLDADCDSGRCESITFEWDDRTTTDSICTRSCDASPDCETTAGGLEGLCAAFRARPFVCYESCVDDASCAPGFRCGELVEDILACFPY